MRAGRPYHHGDLDRVIVDATLAWAAREGVAGISLREIARRAGVSHGAPYHHFGDRAGLFTAIAREGFQRLAEAMREAAAAFEDPRQRFEACGRAYVDFATGSKGHFRIMFLAELKQAKVAEASGAAYAVLAQVVAQCQRVGIARQVDPAALTLLGWATAHGLASLLVDGPLARGPKRRRSARASPADEVARALGALLAANTVKRSRSTVSLPERGESPGAR